MGFLACLWADDSCSWFQDLLFLLFSFTYMRFKLWPWIMRKYLKMSCGPIQRLSHTFLVDHCSYSVKCGRKVCHDAGRAELSRADISLKEISINSGQQESLPYLIQASSLFKWDIYWKTVQHCFAGCWVQRNRGREKMEMWKEAERLLLVVVRGWLRVKSKILSIICTFPTNLYRHNHRMCPK